MLVKFGSESFICEISIHVYKVAMFVYSAIKFINEEALSISFKSLENLISILVSVEETSDIMSIEVVPFKVKGWRKFSSFVKLFMIKYFHSLSAFKDISCLGVNQISLFIDPITLLVNKFSLLIL